MVALMYTMPAHNLISVQSAVFNTITGTTTGQSMQTSPLSMPFPFTTIMAGIGIMTRRLRRNSNSARLQIKNQKSHGQQALICFIKKPRCDNQRSSARMPGRPAYQILFFQLKTFQQARVMARHYSVSFPSTSIQKPNSSLD